MSIGPNSAIGCLGFPLQYVAYYVGFYLDLTLLLITHFWVFFLYIVMSALRLRCDLREYALCANNW